MVRNPQPGERRVARPSLMAVLALAAGMGLARGLQWESAANGMLPAAGFGFVAIGVFAARRWLEPSSARLMVLVSGFLLAGIWMQGMLEARDRVARAAVDDLLETGRERFELRASIEGDPRWTAAGVWFFAAPGGEAISSGAHRAVPGRVVVRMRHDTPGAAALREVAPGDAVRVWGTARPVRARTASGTWERWAAGQGAWMVLDAGMIDGKRPRSVRGGQGCGGAFATPPTASKRVTAQPSPTVRQTSSPR